MKRRLWVRQSRELLRGGGWLLNDILLSNDLGSGWRCVCSIDIPARVCKSLAWLKCGSLLVIFYSEGGRFVMMRRGLGMYSGQT